MRVPWPRWATCRFFRILLLGETFSRLPVVPRQGQEFSAKGRDFLRTSFDFAPASGSVLTKRTERQRGAAPSVMRAAPRWPQRKGALDDPARPTDPNAVGLHADDASGPLRTDPRGTRRPTECPGASAAVAGAVSRASHCPGRVRGTTALSVPAAATLVMGGFLSHEVRAIRPWVWGTQPRAGCPRPTAAVARRAT